MLNKKKIIKINLLILALLQILDGTLTYLGVSKVGTIEIEANPLIRYFMYQIGVKEALVFFKSFACILLIFVYTKIDVVVTNKNLYLFVILIAIFYFFVVKLWLILLIL